jgi:hypothetical protein
MVSGGSIRAGTMATSFGGRRDQMGRQQVSPLWAWSILM